MDTRTFTIGSVTLSVPEEYPIMGRGSGRATAFRDGAKAASEARGSRSPYTMARGSISYHNAWTRGFNAYCRAADRGVAS